jgi:AcrR family transcriptional regulator
MAASELTIESQTRSERKRARNRDAFVAAARHLFARDGFEATTIAAIAEEADLGFGTFYRYFDDKAAALWAVLEEAANEMDAVLLAEDDPAVPASAALSQLTERFVWVASRNRGVFALWFEVSMHPETRTGAESRRARGFPLKVIQSIERVIARGVETGEFVAGDVALRAGLIAGAHMHLLSPWASGPEEQHIIDTLCALELRALSTDRQTSESSERTGQ